MLVVVQVGQCGNQVGRALFESAFANSRDATSTSGARRARETFFRWDASSGLWIARCVAVDTEPKVLRALPVTTDGIRETNDDPGSSLNAPLDAGWAYASSRCVCSVRTGSANNWAFGYHRNGASVYAKLLPLLRKEVARCDDFEGFLLLQSLAGGTGSGLGSFITEQLRRDFPWAFIVNQVVWPYASGEVTVQNYNIVLTLAQLQRSSDAIVLFQNDHLHRICTERLHMAKVSFEALNRVAGDALACMLLPAAQLLPDDDAHALRYPRRLSMAMLVAHLCPSPESKLLTLLNRSAAYETQRWDSLLKHLFQMVVQDAATDGRLNWSTTSTPSLAAHRILATSVTLRGRDVPRPKDFHLNRQLMEIMTECGYKTPRFFSPPLSDGDLLTATTSEWISSGKRTSSKATPTPTQVHSSPLSFLTQDKTVCAVVNSTAPVALLDNALAHALEMYECGAFFHHYERFGLQRDEMERSFEVVAGVIARYRELAQA